MMASEVIVEAEGEAGLDAVHVTFDYTLGDGVEALERLDQGVSVSEDVVVLDPVNPEDTGSSPLELDLTLAIGDEVRLEISAEAAKG